MKIENPIVIGIRLQLRQTVREDIPLKVKWYNDPDVNQTLVLPEILELEKSYQWLEKVKEDSSRADWIIETTENVPIGVIGIKNINTNNHSGLLYIVIGEKAYWGKGLGLEAECLAIHYGFNQMKLHKILGTALETNPGSIRVCEKVGFVQEGCFRDDYCKDGQYYNVFRYGIFADEFYAKHADYKTVKTFPPVR